jgi:3-isopropylmalate dehydrogenase
MARRRVILLPGDGIGPEVTAPAIQELEAVAPGALEYEEHAFGGASNHSHTTARNDKTHKPRNAQRNNVGE